MPDLLAEIEWFGPVPRPFFSTAKNEYYRRAMLQFCETGVERLKEERRDALLAPRPMTPDDVANLVRRVRENEGPASLAARKASSKRWNRLHLADLDAMQRKAGVL